MAAGESGGMRNDGSEEPDFFLRKRQTGAAWIKLYRGGWGNLWIFGAERCIDL